MSQKIYLVKKNPAAVGNSVEWLQLTGREFHTFIKSPQGKGRHFIRLTDDIDYECPEIFIEATYEEYRRWKVGYNRHQYLKEQEDGIETVSTDTPVTAETALIDILSDGSLSLEDVAVERDERHRLRIALRQLTPADYRLVELLYFQQKQRRLEEITAELGITHQALYKRKKKILKKLSEMLVADFEKGQQ